MKRRNLILSGTALSLASLLAPLPSQAQLSPQQEENPPPGSRYAQRASAPKDNPAKKPSYTEKFDLSGLPHYQPEQQVSGKLRIWGNNYIGDANLSDYWAAGFKKFQPGIKIEYNLPSAAIAIPSLYFKLADIGMDHEPGFYDYLGHVRILGTEPIAISAVTGSYDVGGWQSGLVVIVPKENPLTGLTFKQLDGIFGSERTGGWVGIQWHDEFSRGPEINIRTWGGVGLTGEWADKTINPFIPSLRYETALAFSNRVLQCSDKWNEHAHAYGNWKKPDGTVYGWAAHMVDLMKKDPYSIGILMYSRGFDPALKVLAIAKDDASPLVPYTIETQHDRSYPLWSEQSFYISPKKNGKVSPKINEFLHYVLSQEGQEEVERDGKYLPLTAEIVAENLKKLE